MQEASYFRGGGSGSQLKHVCGGQARLRFTGGVLTGWGIVFVGNGAVNIVFPNSKVYLSLVCTSTHNGANCKSDPFRIDYPKPP